MAPTVGRTMHYTLNAGDVARIEYARQQGINEGNNVTVGDVLPAVVTRVWGEGEGTLLNLQVFLDGPDSLWVTSRPFGEDPGCWTWPPRS